MGNEVGMRFEDSVVLMAYRQTVAQGSYDFYRCQSCHHVFSREEEKLAFAVAGKEKSERKVRMCRCGSSRYSPTWPVTKMSILLWRCESEWLQPNVIAYTLKLVLARGIAPWLDRHFRPALRLVEYLVRPKEA